MSDPAPLRIGILGAANIARAFCRGVAGSPLVEVAAVASRTPDKAGAFAAECAIPRAHGSYQALLADPEIEAVYIPLPNHLHAEWAIRAAEAGKHVLCEKPVAIGGAEAQAMFDAARAHGVQLVEAYPYMAQPQTLRLRALIAQGAVGRVQMVSASFGFAFCAPDGTVLRDPDDIRLDPARGGGALLDAGTYSMSLIRIATGERPARVHAVGRTGPSGVDLTVAATLCFPSGAIAQLGCSMATAGHRHATITGDLGVIETSYGNHAPQGAATLPLRVKRGAANPVPFEELTVPATDGFRAEAESFARMIRLGPQHWSGASEAESVDVALALEAIALSAREDRWVTLPSAE
ncbi:Gfo/Idh/MocA family protein [Roseomonas haemaphysalidis]|uniref:Gfo/Idh/MocA family oxidoreductase n=1 Tax=Roseomonas haemaphysalidis TaxID=2768162 RepID=A0ABS3KUX9_9PROT|nr:Gfo/Idh/MocA family oxidoreductase [Roseomonas haemaphysalidis]MBO1080672.1 Gfo/Idh/MocA family oxidoreductase [Roseomonas haemaphysalidis]